MLGYQSQPTATLTSCLRSRRIHLPIFSRLSPIEFLSRCKCSTPTTRQPMVEFCLLAFSRFPFLSVATTRYNINILQYYGILARIKILFFTSTELTTSALVGVRGYLLDHSGDVYVLVSTYLSIYLVQIYKDS